MPRTAGIAVMRVALVVHDLDPGYGQGRYCVELIRHLHPQVQFTIFANSVRQDALPHPVPIIHVPAWRQRSLTTVYSFIPSAELALRRHPCDLVHSQGLASWSADIITAHVCGLARLRGLGTGSNPGLRRFLRWTVPLERRFYRRRRARHLIAISGVVAREIEADYGWKRPVSIIHHGTDLDRFRPPSGTGEAAGLRRKFGVPDQAWLWLFVGEAAKGLASVIEILPRFPNAHLLIVSRSPLDPLETRARSLGIRERITFHGPTQSVELAYRAADAFVYPAPYDAFAMVATEAMASGLPVILGKTIGAAELVRDGHNGLVCDTDPPSDLRKCLERLEQSPDRGRSLGAAARATLEHHTWQHCAAATLDVYQRVGAERGLPQRLP